MPKTEQLQQNESLAHTIRNRRSIRSFKPETVPSEVILDMLETAVYAPNHRTDGAMAFYLRSKRSGKSEACGQLRLIFQK